MHAVPYGGFETNLILFVVELLNHGVWQLLAISASFADERWLRFVPDQRLITRVRLTFPVM